MRIRRKLTSFSGHLQVTPYSYAYEEAPLERIKGQSLKQAIPNVIKSINVFAHKALLIEAEKDIEGIVCKGLDPFSYLLSF